MSYWDRPFFPEWCSHSTFDDAVTFDTMVRIAGSYLGFAVTFKAIADRYGWTHIVLVSNYDTNRVCWFGATSFDAVFSNNENYTFTWLRFNSDPTAEQLDDILHQIRSLTRGLTKYLLAHYILTPVACLRPTMSRKTLNLACITSNSL